MSATACNQLVTGDHKTNQPDGLMGRSTVSPTKMARRRSSRAKAPAKAAAAAEPSDDDEDDEDDEAKLFCHCQQPITEGATPSAAALFHPGQR